MSNWYQSDIKSVIRQFKTDGRQGLAEAEATHRLAEYGPNELVEQNLKNPWRILWEQLTATMVVILIIAAAISAALGDYKDAVAIIAIVVLNALLGFRQEYRAEQAMATLKKLAVPVVKVRRDGQIRQLAANNLVPGDIVSLEAGNLVPADGRLLETANLRVQEAALTGESEPVEKEAQRVFDTEQALGDRQNMVYLGTTVTYGRGQMLITETGMQTELGHIASLIQTMDRERTPLQRRLDQLGRGLAIVALGIVTLIFILGLLRGEPARLMFLTAVSLAVAAVPEGLPAVVTIALALGAQRMLKRNALIRKLPAVETLGSVTVICSDKTGTLTENQMTVTILDVAGRQIDLSQQDAAWIAPETEPVDLSNEPALSLLLTGGALCNDAVLQFDQTQPAGTQVVGDPTEGALVMAAAHWKLQKDQLEQILPRVAEVPFDSQRKRMTTFHRNPLTEVTFPSELGVLQSWGLAHGHLPYVAFTKGAVDGLLEISSQVWVEDHIEFLSESWRTRILDSHNRLAQQGMRILGIAFRPTATVPYNGTGSSLEQELIFIGLVGMIDPPRAEVRAAVQTCQTAGIRPMMITGDHPLTAGHIAQQLGITQSSCLLTGQDLDRMSAREIDEAVAQISVYARVSPEHKLHIVQALQDQGQIVAMTGDGINDAPALKKANIGIAMGVTGTDVAKEAAAMVLRDDNFATIVAAVESGRIIYDNIRKFIKYLLSCNAGEIWTMLLAPFLGMPLPLLPLQILWMNLVTDGLPALALGVEPAERDIMRRPPHPPHESIFSRDMLRNITWVGLLMGFVSLGIGYLYWLADKANWQTMLFTVLTLSQMTLALAVRSEQDSLFHIGLGSNKPLLAAVSLTLLLQLGIIYIPFMQTFFETQALTPGDLVVALLLSTIVFWALELEKWMRRQRLKRKKPAIFGNNQEVML